MIRTERHDAVLLVTLDRPERRNAVNVDTLAALDEVITQAHAAAGAVPATPSPDPVRVLVLAGAHGHFCSGADLGDVTDERFLGLLNRVLSGLRDASFPTMAAVDGFALGAGTQLAIACDLRMATPTATFGVPAARLGLMVDQWTVRRLVALVGQSTARDVLLSTDQLPAERAHGLGLVHRLGTLDDAHTWADRIARLAPLTLAGLKVGLNEADPSAPTTEAYAAASARAWGSTDFAEGLQAFHDKRPPRFEGR